MRGRHHRGGGAEVLRSGAARDAEVLKLSGGGGSGGRGGSPGTGPGTGEVEGRQGRRGAASRGSRGSVAALSSALPLNVVRSEAWERLLALCTASRKLSQTQLLRKKPNNSCLDKKYLDVQTAALLPIPPHVSVGDPELGLGPRLGPLAAPRVGRLIALAAATALLFLFLPHRRLG